MPTAEGARGGGLGAWGPPHRSASHGTAAGWLSIRLGCGTDHAWAARTGNARGQTQTLQGILFTSFKLQYSSRHVSAWNHTNDTHSTFFPSMSLLFFTQIPDKRHSDCHTGKQGGGGGDVLPTTAMWCWAETTRQANPRGSDSVTCRVLNSQRTPKNHSVRLHPGAGQPGSAARAHYG